jgi:hypothetical protein
MQVEGSRLAHQFHIGFDGKLIALLPIAGVAAGHEIFPSGSSTSRTWHYVVQRQFTRRQDFPAILAGVAVTQQDVLA